MDSKQIIRSYMVIASIYTLSASLIWGVNTLFLLDAGLDIFGVFVANAVFTGAMVIFEVPTGIVADTSGRRTSFLLSTVVLCLATLGYVGVSLVGGGLFWFCVMSVFLGLGFTFYSGAVEAWLVDALQSTHFTGELENVFARAGMITNALMLIGTVSGGLLGNVDLAIPYVGRALLLAMVFGWGYLHMHDIGYTPRALTLSAVPAEVGKVARESITFGWQQQPVRLIMIVTFIHGLYGIWGFYATQPYFLDLLGQPDAIWVAGVVAALVSTTMIASNWLLNRYISLFRSRTTILIAASAILTASTIGVGVVDSFWLAVPLFLLGTLAFGIFMPVKQGYLHRLIPSAQRATVISFDAMLGSGGGVVGQSGLGYLARQQNIAAGFVVGGATTVLAIPFLLILRRLNNPADHIKANGDLPLPAIPEGMIAKDP
ncbi:MAG: MFS transporter [Chloroflexi bacterium]|nr:MFS transporter [Chloroflexota bacterium]